MNADNLIPTPLGPRYIAAPRATTGAGAARLLERARWRREATLAAATLSAHAVVSSRPAAFGDRIAIAAPGT